MYLSNPFYGCENWFLNDAVLNLLHSRLGELSKRILRLPKWYSNTAAMVCWIRVLPEPGVCSRTFLLLHGMSYGLECGLVFVVLA